MKRVLAAMTAASLLIALVPSATLASSLPGKGYEAPLACITKGGWPFAAGVNGQFASQTDCVVYAAKGGTLLATSGVSEMVPGVISVFSEGWNFTPGAKITLTYTVLGVLNVGPRDVSYWVLNYGYADMKGYFGAGGPHGPSDSGNGLGDTCMYDTGSGTGITLQTTNLTYTLTASDGTHSVTVTSFLRCSLLAP